MAKEKADREETEETKKQERPREKSSDKASEKPELEEPVKKKGKFKLILIVMLLLIVAGGAGGYFLFGKKLMAKYLGKPSEGAPQQEAVQKKEHIGPILQMEPFVFNLTGSQSKYAKVTLGIEVKDPKVMEEAKKMVPVIRDKILFIFGTKAPEVLMDVNQREAIKKEVYASLKGLFKDGEELKAVYITDIIIQ